MKQTTRRIFNRETPEQRKQELINATLDIIGELGFAAATVRAISEQAEVTQGLIRHYFKSKEELISTAYEYHMNEMTSQALDTSEQQGASALEKLKTVIIQSVDSDVSSQANLTLWATFISKIHTAHEIKETHEKTYLWFRDGLEILIKEALEEAGRKTDPGQLRKLAVMSNAVIDGLWIEAAAVPSEFLDSKVRELVLRSVGSILELPLWEAEKT